MDSSERSAKRLKHESMTVVVNSLQLVSGANLPIPIELSVLSFLPLCECAELITLSKAMYELVKAHFSQLLRADVRDSPSGLSTTGSVLRLIQRHSGRLRALAASGSFVQDHWDRVAPLLTDVVRANRATLERVSIDPLTPWSLPLLEALPLCPGLCEFRDEGLVEPYETTAPYRAAVLRVFEACPLSRFEHPGYADTAGQLFLDPPVLRELFTPRRSTLRALVMDCQNPGVIPALALLTALETLSLALASGHPEGILASLASPLRSLTSLRELTVRCDDKAPSPPWELSSTLTSLTIGTLQQHAEDLPHLEIRASDLRSVDCPLSDAALCALLESNASLTSLSVPGRVDLESATCDALLKRSAMTRLTLHCSSLPPRLLSALARSLPALTMLSYMLVDTAPSDAISLLTALPSMTDFQTTCLAFRSASPLLSPLSAPVALPKLESLFLGDCDDSLLRLRLPNLRRLTVITAARSQPELFAQFVAAAGAVPRLQALSMGGVAWLDDSVLRALLTPLPALERLSLKHCLILRVPAALGVVAQCSPALLRLTILHCFHTPESETESQQVDRLCALYRALPRLQTDLDYPDEIETQARERLAAEAAASKSKPSDGDGLARKL